MSDLDASLATLHMSSLFLAESRASGSRALHVIPCITDDLAGCEGTIFAAVTHAGGTVAHVNNSELSTGSPDWSGAIAGSPPVAWKARVEAALEFDSLAGRYRVLIGVDKDSITSTYEGDGEVVLPGQEDVVLRVAKALCSTQVLESEFAVIIYDDTELDADQKAVLWNLTAHIQGAHLDHLRTLVLLAKTTLKLNLHAERDTGFRWAVVNEALVKRDHPNNLNVQIAKVANSSAPVTVLFLGAGFSASSGLPLGNTLRDEAIVAMGIGEPGRSSWDLARAFYEWLAQNGRLIEFEQDQDLDELSSQLTLERVLREEYRLFDGEDPPTLVKFAAKCREAAPRRGAATEHLAKLIRSGHRLVICTVNFDELIEASVEPEAIRVFSSDEEFESAADHLSAYMAGRTDTTPVWKLHGTISRIPTCVATDAVTLLGLSEHKAAALAALTELSESPLPWLYIGASMRDSDLGPLLGAKEFEESFREQWAMPYSIESVERFVRDHRSERWLESNKESYQARVITHTADTTLAALSDRMSAKPLPVGD